MGAVGAVGISASSRELDFATRQEIGTQVIEINACAHDTSPSSFERSGRRKIGDLASPVQMLPKPATISGLTSPTSAVMVIFARPGLSSLEGLGGRIVVLGIGCFPCGVPIQGSSGPGDNTLDFEGVGCGGAARTRGEMMMTEISCLHAGAGDTEERACCASFPPLGVVG